MNPSSTDTCSMMAFGRLHTCLGQAELHSPTIDPTAVVVSGIGNTGNDGVRIDVRQLVAEALDGGAGTFRSLDTLFTRHVLLPNDAFQGAFAEQTGMKAVIRYAKRQGHYALEAECTGITEIGVEKMTVQWLYQGTPQLVMTFPTPQTFPAGAFSLGSGASAPANDAEGVQLEEDPPPNTWYFILNGDGTYGVAVDYQTEDPPVAEAAGGAPFRLPTGNVVLVDFILITFEGEGIRHEAEGACVDLTAASMSQFMVLEENENVTPGAVQGGAQPARSAAGL